MMDFIKKQGIGFYASIATIILLIVCLSLTVSNGNAEYYGDIGKLGGVIAMLIIAIVLTVATGVVSQFSFAENKIVRIAIDVARAAIALLIIVAGISFAGARIESFGYIYGSNLEMGNDLAFTAGNQAITTIIIHVVTWVVAMAAAFFAITRNYKRI